MRLATASCPAGCQVFEYGVQNLGGVKVQPRASFVAVSLGLEGKLVRLSSLWVVTESLSGASSVSLAMKTSSSTAVSSPLWSLSLSQPSNWLELLVAVGRVTGWQDHLGWWAVLEFSVVAAPLTVATVEVSTPLSSSLSLSSMVVSRLVWRWICALRPYSVQEQGW